jgi:hypothetical protein
MKLEPNKFWFQIAQVHERFKNYKEAIDCIDKVLTLDPTNEAAQRYKVALLNGLKYGENYFIPLATVGTLLWSIPPNKEIIYATNMDLSFFPAYVGKNTSKRRVSTNALFTDEGVVCSFPIARSRTLKPTFIPFSQIRFPKMTHMAVGPKGPYQPFTFRLSRVSFYEKLNNFTSRSRVFKEKMRNVQSKMIDGQSNNISIQSKVAEKTEDILGPEALQMLIKGDLEGSMKELVNQPELESASFEFYSEDRKSEKTSVVFCPNCRSQSPKDNKFCDQCGTKLK